MGVNPTRQVPVRTEFKNKAPMPVADKSDKKFSSLLTSRMKETGEILGPRKR